MAKIKKSAQDAEHADTVRVKKSSSDIVEDKNRETSSRACSDNGDTDEPTKSNVQGDDIDEMTRSDIRVEDLDDMFTEMEGKGT